MIVPAQAYKNLVMFVLASSALMFCGYVYNYEYDPYRITCLLWLDFSGLYLIYRLNDFIDAQPKMHLNVRLFFADWKHTVMTLQLFLVAIPLAFFQLTFFSVAVLSIAALIGMLYSIQFRFGDFKFRLKNVFLLKNVLIGIVWGSLVLAGYGFLPNQPVLQLFAFVSIQVIIGSIIRDIPDISSDLKEGVNSLPVVLGKPTTFLVMHLLNALSLLCVLMGVFDWDLVILVAIAGGWRLVNLVMVMRKDESTFWTQQANLLTCVLIAVIVTFQVVYSQYA